MILVALLVACTTPAPEAPPPPEPDPAEVAAPADPAAEPPPADGPEIPPAVRAAVDAPDRSEADRALDAGRHPAETLAFFEIAPGQRVLEVGAGGGYTAELLARVVGPEGRVVGHNAPFVLERFAEAPWSARLAKPVNANVSRLDAAFDAPIPEGVAPLDAVVNILFYHDTVWQEVDRAAMNAHLFAALKPGGVYGIVDHAARPEDGLTVTKTLHRIPRDVVVSEIEAAGFVLEAEADFLHAPDDTRDWNAAPGASGDQRGTSHRFALRFRKPAGAAGSP